MDRVKQRKVREDLEGKPTEDELIAALAKLKNGKAGGNSQILPEMVKTGCVKWDCSHSTARPCAHCDGGG